MFFVLFACLKFVVRFLKALRIGAEILLALGASHAEFTHALGGLTSDRIVVPILLLHINLALLNAHDVTAVAADEIWIILHKGSQNDLVILLPLFAQIHVELLLRH